MAAEPAEEAEMDEFDMFAARARCGGSSLALSRECKSLPGTPPTDSPAHYLGDTSETSTLSPRINGSISDGHSPRKHRIGRMTSDPGEPEVISGNGTELQRSQSYRRPPRVHWEDKDVSGHKWQRTRSVTVRKQSHGHIDTQTHSRDGEPHYFSPDHTRLQQRRGSSIPEIDVDKFDEYADCKIYRVRSFTTRHGGGIVNRGDSFKVKNRSRAGGSLKRTGGDTVAPHITHTPHLPSQLPKCPTITVQDDSENTPLTKNREDDFDDGPIALPPPVVTVTAESPVREQVPSCLSPSHLDLEGVMAGQCPSPDEDEEDDEDYNEDEDEQNISKVLVLGAQGVGKTTLTQQLLTSEYLANTEQEYFDEEGEKVVSVSLDDVESMIQFIDVPGFEANRNRESVDAHVIVYSVTDKNSFNYAQACLQDLKKIRERHDVVILVANKQDLVRNRAVTEEEGRALATKRKCKFIELSAMLDHKVDELLVGILRQIRLKQQAKQEDDEANLRNTGCLYKATFGLFRKMFRRQKYASKSCDNLLTP